MLSTAETETFTWEQLSIKAKQAAYEEAREWNVQHNGWWDSTYEDATRIGALLGIAIDKIQFSGFCNQGDGASYAGFYIAEPDAALKIKTEAPTDTELLRIAERLTQIQIAYSLMYGASVQASITLDNKRYCHEMAMNFELIDEDGAEPNNKRAKELVSTLRDFARWIYKNLEAEYEYLTSEECVFEQLTSGDYEFDEDGRII